MKGVRRVLFEEPEEGIHGTVSNKTRKTNGRSWTYIEIYNQSSLIDPTEPLIRKDKDKLLWLCAKYGVLPIEYQCWYLSEIKIPKDLNFPSTQVTETSYNCCIIL